MEKFKSILKASWPLILTVMISLCGSFGVVSFSKGERLEIHVMLPEDAANVFGEPTAFRGGSDFSEGGRRALRMGAWHIRNGAEGRELFAVMRAIHNDPTLLAKAEQAAANPSQLDPVTVAIAVKIAIQIAVAILERTAPGTKTELDDRLLALLKLFQMKPEVIPSVRKAIVR